MKFIYKKAKFEKTSGGLANSLTLLTKQKLMYVGSDYNDSIFMHPIIYYWSY